MSRAFKPVFKLCNSTIVESQVCVLQVQASLALQGHRDSIRESNLLCIQVNSTQARLQECLRGLGVSSLESF